MSKPITAKVAKILNSYELAISAGKNQGVRPGMEFSIINPLGKSIIDPDTGEELGSVSLEKVRVVVTKVEDDFSIVESRDEYVVENDRGAGLNNLAVFGYTPKKVVRRSFRTASNGKEYTQQDKGFVEVGDIVEEVQEGNFANEQHDRVEGKKMASA